MILTLIGLSALSFALYATTITTPLALELIVDQKGGGTFLSIQEANDSGRVNPGDILKVWWGPDYDPYTENVNATIPNLTIKSDVIHNSAVKPVIDGGDKGAVFNVFVNNVAIFNFTIQNGQYGINLSSVAVNATLIDNLVTNNSQYGIHTLSENNTIKGNILTTNNFGMDICSSGSFLRNNNMTNNTYNFGISNFINNDIDTTNTVNGKPIYIWIDKHHETVPDNAGYIAVVNSTEIVVAGDLKLSSNDYGVQFINTSNSTIEDVKVSSNFKDDVLLCSVTNCKVENIDASFNEEAGIYLSYSKNNVITANKVSNNSYIGIALIYSDNNSIIGNIIPYNQGWAGITLSSSERNFVIENKISNNLQYNITSEYRLHNQFYHNNIVGETPYQIWYSELYDTQDNGTEGNYWSNYKDRYPGVEDKEGDGIRDHYYEVDSNNFDRYPLVNQWKPVRLFNVAKIGIFSGYKITIESNHVIASLNFTRIGAGIYPRQLSFNVTAGSSGFCVIIIPRAWLDGPFTLLINNISKPFNVKMQNATHSTLLFTYDAGKYQVKIEGIESGTVLGDINRDGEINMRDVGWVARLFGKELPDNLTPEDITTYNDP